MSLTRSSESYANGEVRLSLPGNAKPANGRIARAGIDVGDDFVLLAPVFVPDLADVRAFAGDLHQRKQAWRGVAFGWNASYEPLNPEPPPASKATFTPATFCIGDALAWCCCITWEYGDDQPPVEIVTTSLIADVAPVLAK